jgi:hypothetical protein
MIAGLRLHCFQIVRHRMTIKVGNLWARKMKAKEKVNYPKMRTTVDIGTLLLLAEGIVMPGLNLILCLLRKMVPGASLKTIMVVELLGGMKLNPVTKALLWEVGILLLTAGISPLLKYGRKLGAKEMLLRL